MKKDYKSETTIAERTCYLRTPLFSAILGLQRRRELWRRETWLDVAAREVESCGGERRGEIWQRLRRTCNDGQLFGGVNSGRSNGEAEGR